MNWLLIYTKKFTQPPLLRTLFRDPPPPSEAYMLYGCPLVAPARSPHFMGFLPCPLLTVPILASGKNTASFCQKSVDTQFWEMTKEDLNYSLVKRLYATRLLNEYIMLDSTGHAS